MAKAELNAAPRVSEVASRVALALVAVGCVLTPRSEDVLAPKETYAQLTEEESACAARVELVPVGGTARPHQELARISVSCYPGAHDLCERRLKQRACELQADAVLLLASQAGGAPPGALRQSQVFEDAIAVRWK